MASRGREPDDPPRSESTDGDRYPLLFKGDASPSRSGFLGRIVARVLRFFREPPEEGADPAGPASLPPTTGAQPAQNAVERPTPDPVDSPEDVPEEPTRDAVEPTTDGISEVDEDASPGVQKGESEEIADEADEPQPDTPLHRATLQMLPGRLIPVRRDQLRQEIRFLRPSNPEQEVILGWRSGEPPDHVTIDHPSIQMRHARMRHRRGHWWIESLSEEAPVLLNGLAIGPEAGPRHLKDGDRVRFGEVDFDFRMP